MVTRPQYLREVIGLSTGQTFDDRIARISLEGGHSSRFMRTRPSRPGDPRGKLKSMSRPANNDQTGDDRASLREGEIAVELPAKFDAQLYFIGRIRTPWKRRDDCPKNGRETEEVCTIELDPRWAAGLQGLETVSHVLVLYWMDKARRDLVLQSPRHYAEHRGTFALRSPVRPNPIAAAVTRLKRIEGNKLFVVGLDCMDGTPLLDLKPYFASTDSAPDASVGWHASRKR
jgi:tRNA-Thr(GGU) m(6)t(6)A37 methyltransferase TsaA